jgi:signal transduction histidine kinase
MLPPPEAEPSETLVAVGRVLALDLPLEEAMRRVTRLVARAFGADMGGAYFLDAAREALAPLAGYHVPDDLLETFRRTPFPIARFAFLQEARRTGEAVWTADYAGDPRFDQDFLASYRPRALLFVPTTLRGEMVGGLFLAWWTEARRFAPEEPRLAAAVASQVSLTLEKADLIRRMQEQLRETEILAEVAKSINTALDLGVVLQRVAEGARELTRGDQAVIALRDVATGTMRFRYWAGAAYEGYPALRIEPGKGSGGQVLVTGRPFRTRHYAEDPRITKDYLESVHANRVVAQMVVPIKAEDRIDGLLYVENRSTREFTDHDEAILLRLADHAAIAIRNARLFAALQAQAAELRAHRDRLRVLSAESAKAKEEEARRIARELHDEAGQLLAAVHLAVHEMANDLPPARRGHAAKIQRFLDQIEEQLRRLSHELRPTILDNLGLQPALLFLAQGVTGRTGVLVSVKGSTEGRLPLPVETAVYRIVQEALTNASKHSRATRVEVELRRKPQAIFCSIRDNGVGFDPERVVRSADAPGLGLLGIHERLHALGGTLEIVSAPGQGTELRVSIPIEPD